MNSSGGVKFLSRFVEWLLSFYQDAVDGLIDMLTGGQTDGALMWLMKSWKSLFLLLLIGGIVLNVIIYFVRWKPHWWWFAKKRMVVDDALVEKKQKRAADPAPARKPSTYIPKRIEAAPAHKAPARGSLTDDGDLMATDGDDLMRPHKSKKRQ